MKKEEIIAKFHMVPHEEGGYYAEIFRKEDGSLSQIYYLLEKGETAQWHRLCSDELWFFHDGGDLLITLGGNGDVPKTAKTFRMNKEYPSFPIEKQQWQTAKAIDGDVLVSCVVSPGFTWEQWELYPKEDQK